MLLVQWIKCIWPHYKGRCWHRGTSPAEAGRLPRNRGTGHSRKAEGAGNRSWRREWLLGSHCCLKIPDGVRDKAEPVFTRLYGKRIKFWMNVRNYSLPWGWSSTEGREAMHVLPLCYWQPNWKRKALGTLTRLWLWPCFDQGLSQRPLESSYNLNYFIYIVLI